MRFLETQETMIFQPVSNKQLLVSLTSDGNLSLTLTKCFKSFWQWGPSDCNIGRLATYMFHTELSIGWLPWFGTRILGDESKLHLWLCNQGHTLKNFEKRFTEKILSNNLYTVFLSSLYRGHLLLDLLTIDKLFLSKLPKS